jgi:hypothetical protein
LTHADALFSRGLARILVAGRRPRLALVDHGVTAQALERIEVCQVFLRLARLHGDTADRAVADGGRWRELIKKALPEYRRAAVDLDQCGLQPLRLALRRRQRFLRAI